MIATNMDHHWLYRCYTAVHNNFMIIMDDGVSLASLAVSTVLVVGLIMFFVFIWKGLVSRRIRPPFGKNRYRYVSFRDVVDDVDGCNQRNRDDKITGRRLSSSASTSSLTTTVTKPMHTSSSSLPVQLSNKSKLKKYFPATNNNPSSTSISGDFSPIIGDDDDNRTVVTLSGGEDSVLRLTLVDERIDNCNYMTINRAAPTRIIDNENHNDDHSSSIEQSHTGTQPLATTIATTSGTEKETGTQQTTPRTKATKYGTTTALVDTQMRSARSSNISTLSADAALHMDSDTITTSGTNFEYNNYVLTGWMDGLGGSVCLRNESNQIVAVVVRRYRTVDGGNWCIYSSTPQYDGQNPYRKRIHKRVMYHVMTITKGKHPKPQQQTNNNNNKKQANSSSFWKSISSSSKRQKKNRTTDTSSSKIIYRLQMEDNSGKSYVAETCDSKRRRMMTKLIGGGPRVVRIVEESDDNSPLPCALIRQSFSRRAEKPTWDLVLMGMDDPKRCPPNAILLFVTILSRSMGRTQ